jgi:hypothetical protein
MKQRILAAGFCIALVTALACSTVVTAFAADSQTLTGVVSDSMCGAKHVMKGSDAACTKACVEHGANYALVSGDKVYTLDGDKEELGKYAGQSVTVTGAVDGDKIKVESVKAAKS